MHENQFSRKQTVPAHIISAATLEKRQCLARFFTSLASVAFFMKRKRVAKEIICAGAVCFLEN